MCVFFPLAVSRQEAGAGEGGAAVISTVMWKWKLLSILHAGRAEELMLIFIFPCLCAAVRLCARSTHIPVSRHSAHLSKNLACIPYYYYSHPTLPVAAANAISSSLFWAAEETQGCFLFLVPTCTRDRVNLHPCRIRAQASVRSYRFEAARSGEDSEGGGARHDVTSPVPPHCSATPSPLIWKGCDL